MAATKVRSCIAQFRAELVFRSLKVNGQAQWSASKNTVIQPYRSGQRSPGRVVAAAIYAFFNR
jgi:hypothetical protein